MSGRHAACISADYIQFISMYLVLPFPSFSIKLTVTHLRLFPFYPGFVH